MTFNPPSWLAQEAKELWTSIAPILEADGRLTEQDVPAFIALCVAYSTMISAAKELAEEGVTAIGWGGEAHNSSKKHPAAQVFRDSEKTFTSLCDRFGLNPKARRGMALPQPADDAGGLLD